MLSSKLKYFRLTFQMYKVLLICSYEDDLLEARQFDSNFCHLTKLVSLNTLHLSRSCRSAASHKYAE